MKHLYFCRHGQSVLNQQGRLAGSTETPLTDDGRLQARLAGQSATDFGIDYIVCSPQSRALETAQIIARELGYPETKLDINSLVIERHFGAMEGHAWHPDLNLDGIIDAETVDSVIERARMTLKHLETVDADTVLIVSHGSFGRALRHIIHPEIPFARVNRFENAQIVKLV